jgi:hypothetical protein
VTAAVLARGGAARVVVDDRAPGRVFAEAPLGHPSAVAPVLDSGRCFVLRVAGGARHAFVGIGFHERNEASDFKFACAASRRAAEDFGADPAVGRRLQRPGAEDSDSDRRRAEAQNAEGAGGRPGGFEPRV